MWCLQSTNFPSRREFVDVLLRHIPQTRSPSQSSSIASISADTILFVRALEEPTASLLAAHNSAISLVSWDTPQQPSSQKKSQPTGKTRQKTCT
jgi:hypothetical protein